MSKKESAVWITTKTEKDGSKSWVLRYKFKGRIRQVNTKLEAKKGNAKAAEKLRNELEIELSAHGVVDRITVEEFEIRYRAERLNWQSRNYGYVWSSGMLKMSQYHPVKYLDQIDEAYLSGFSAEVRKENKVSEATLRSYLRHILTSLNWAAEHKLIAKAPMFRIGRKEKKQAAIKHMRSRPITGEEKDRIMDAVALVRPDDANKWKRFIEGLWLTGLRVSEATILGWDEESEFRLVLNTQYPHYRILTQKSGSAEYSALPQDAIEFFKDKKRFPRRTGDVFAMNYSLRWIKQVIGKIGTKSRVIVDPKTRKTVTAHDFRRSFGTRWALKKVPTAVLQKMMRHADIATTAKYYVNSTVEEIGRFLQSVDDPNPASSPPTPTPSADSDEMKELMRQLMAKLGNEESQENA